MDREGRFVPCVSFRSVMRQFRIVRLPPSRSLISRLVYPSWDTVTTEVVNAVDGSVVRPSIQPDLRELVRRYRLPPP